MAVVIFDVRRAERRLKAAGASDELAEATADLMSEAVLLNHDSLVTKEYLDARLDRQDAVMKAEFRRVHALLALLMAGVFLPQVQAWLGG